MCFQATLSFNHQYYKAEEKAEESSSIFYSLYCASYIQTVKKVVK